MVVLLLLGWRPTRRSLWPPRNAKQGVIYRILSCSGERMDRPYVFLYLLHRELLYVYAAQPRWDWLGVSAGDVRLVFTTVDAPDRPIWAHPFGESGDWDARLTSTFVLCCCMSLIYSCGAVEEPDRRALLSGVFGIFAFIDVPLVFGFDPLVRTQHPQPILWAHLVWA